VGPLLLLQADPGFPWQTRIESRTAVVALSVASSFGIFFGWYPARRAAATDPIDALRYE
jgi:putative ABC transport system permease protein